MHTDSNPTPSGDISGARLFFYFILKDVWVYRVCMYVCRSRGGGRREGLGLSLGVKI